MILKGTGTLLRVSTAWREQKSHTCMHSRCRGSPRNHCGNAVALRRDGAPTGKQMLPFMSSGQHSHKTRMKLRKIRTPQPTLLRISYPSNWDQHCPHIATDCKSSHRKLGSRPTLRQKKLPKWATTDLCKNTLFFEKQTVYTTFPISRPTLQGL